MRVEGPVDWSELTPEEQAEFAASEPEAKDPSLEWTKLGPPGQWRWFTDFLAKRVENGPDGVLIIPHDLAAAPGHRTEHLYISDSQGIMLRVQGVFERKAGGWERKGTERSLIDEIPAGFGRLREV